MEKEILKYLYESFDSGSTWDENFNDLMNSKDFQGTIRKKVKSF